MLRERWTMTTRSAVPMLAILVLTALPTAGAAQTPDYLDPDLPIERRVDDLVGRMTLEEKVAQMQNAAPAIDRLGVPAYDWWSEALHGVARSGLATVFPQAIGIAATWDDSLVYGMARVISVEARAKYHQSVREGREGQRYGGLTFWSPNINIFRDPRWGRGQETWGEDPFLTSRMSVPFIRGLQGNDPKYLETVATVKHFAVHSGPEPERHEFDAWVSERDFHETYLPAFEAGIREGGARSLMCAYNSLYGDPACSNDALLAGILRGEWGFDGYVVSDCGAIRDIYRNHKVVEDRAEASALAVEAGTDLNCGRVFAPGLVEAVRLGFVSEVTIDRSVKRLFTERFRLGMFDPPDRVAYARIPYDSLDTPGHRALAAKVARESMVLLKNDGPLLPLRKDVGTIAVIGPNADQPEMLLGNYNGTPADPITPLRGIREAVGAAHVLYARGSDLADGLPTYDPIPARVLHTPSGRAGLRVEYFDHYGLEGAPLFSGIDSALDADWGDGAPRADMSPDSFAVRWTGTLRPDGDGVYRLGLIGTSHYRMFLDDSLVLQSRSGFGSEASTPLLVATDSLHLEGGHSYRIRVEAQESRGDARTKLVWVDPARDLEGKAVDAAQKADAVVLFLGLTSRLEGEEMPIDIPGFEGGDRTDLKLPAPQEHLLQRIMAVGKPTVLVLLNGSALAVDWADEHVPAILEAWYPGQAAGTAIADVLFGDYDPAGRLPVTFYRRVDDLPPFESYAMEGRTYRYFHGDVLYPFGYGLSYTTFNYGDLRSSADSIGADGRITVSVDVTNSGTTAGDEVAQLYVAYPGSAVERPIRDLRGFRRVHLRPGETRTVTFPLTGRDLAYWDPESRGWRVEGGRVRLEVGASSADIRVSREISTGAGTPSGPGARY